MKIGFDYWQVISHYPDQIDIDIDEILRKYAAYCDQYNREVEYDTSDNIDQAQAHAAIKLLMLKEREAEVKKAQMYIPDDEYGHYLRGRIKNLEGEIEGMQG